MYNKKQNQQQSEMVKSNLQPQGEVASLVVKKADELTTTFDQVLERMKQATGSVSDTAFAKKMGLNQSSISGAKERQRIPPIWAVQIAETLDVSLDWLMFGQGSMHRGAVSGSKPVQAGQDGSEQGEHIYNDMIDCELVMVPLVEAKLSAGSGSFETNGDLERLYAFRSEWIRSKGNAQAMVLMRVAGDSMEPEIKDKDVVLIDTSNTDLRLGRMFAVAVEDLVYLKKVDAEPGKLILTSANPAYGALEIDARGDRSEGIRIIGRAVWVGRDLD